MRIALLTTDNREHLKLYQLEQPIMPPPQEALLTGLSRIPEVEIHVVSCTQRQMHAPEKLFSNVWFHLLHVPKFGWLRTGYQGCIRAIRRKLRELQPDIVHGQGTERECAISAVLSGFPNVITIHGNMAAVARSLRASSGSYLWCAAFLEKLVLKRSDGVFCNSAYTESVVQSRAKRTWRVPNAIRQQFFERLHPVSAASNTPTLLNVGVITPYKRQLELLELAEQLYQEGHRFQLQFIGAASPGNRYAAEFLRRIESTETRGFARHVQAKTLEDLIIALDEAGALVHVPSEEAFGLVVAEALARNLKFFGSKVGGIPDIANGVDGAELFPLDDVEQLRTAIAHWLQSGCPRPTAAAKIMHERYHPLNVARRHAEIYRELLSKDS